MTEEYRTFNEAASKFNQAASELFRLLAQPLIDLAKRIKRAFIQVFNQLRLRAGFANVRLVRGRYQLVNSRFLLKRVKVVHAKPRTRKRR